MEDEMTEEAKMFYAIRMIAVSSLILLLVQDNYALAKLSGHRSPVDPVSAGQLKSDDETVNQELAAVRRATEHYHRLENAINDGYIQLSECVENPPVGGMGYHYGNMDFLLDQEANLLEPDVLVYEPQANGKLRLVAVEYIVPVFAGEPSDPPTLFGHEMHWDEELHAWTLHAWIWQANPSGIFEHWNPNVDCNFDFAS